MSQGAVHRGRSPGAYPHYHPYQPHGSSPHHSPGRHPSAERQQSNEMHMHMIGLQPGGGFLVPPQDTSWRRTHSDPGLHASTMHPNMPGSNGSQSHTPPHGSPGQTPLGASPPGQSYMSHVIRPGSVDHHGGTTFG